MNNYEIKRKAMRDERATDKWLSQNGLDAQKLNALNLGIQQAQMIATNLLKHNAKLLGQNQAATLNSFLQASHNAKKQKRLTMAACYTVMNIGKAVNRKMFKINRQLNQG